MRRHTRTFLAFLAAILFLSSGRAWAQFNQYTPHGGPQERPESRKERLEREVEEARYRLGPVRISPWLGLRDASYIRGFFSNQESPPSDFTATLGAGGRAYLRTGRKVIWTGEVLPEYVWWSGDSDRSRVNGRYGLGLHAFFNRLTVEATATRRQEQQLLTPELPQPASARADNGRVQAELWVTSALTVFADAGLTRVRYLDAEEIEVPLAERLTLLDREEEVTRAGVRWRPREGWMVGLGAESSRVDFESDPLDRSNEGTAPVLEAIFDRPKLFVQADLAARSLEARQGARFVDFEGVTGSVTISLRPRRRTEFWLYGSRNLVYSLEPAYAYLDDQRQGVALGSRLGGRTISRVFVETGEEDYTAFDPAAQLRNDDLFSYGASMTFRVRGPVTFTLQAVRTEFDSNLPGNDRSYTYVGTQLNLLGGR
jgi:hypothetical protein